MNGQFFLVTGLFIFSASQQMAKGQFSLTVQRKSMLFEAIKRSSQGQLGVTSERF